MLTGGPETCWCSNWCREAVSSYRAGYTNRLTLSRSSHLLRCECVPSTASRRCATASYSLSAATAKVLKLCEHLPAHRNYPVFQKHLVGWMWPKASLRKSGGLDLSKFVRAQALGRLQQPRFQ